MCYFRGIKKKKDMMREGDKVWRQCCKKSSFKSLTVSRWRRRLICIIRNLHPTSVGCRDDINKLKRTNAKEPDAQKQKNSIDSKHVPGLLCGWWISNVPLLRLHIRVSFCVKTASEPQPSLFKSPFPGQTNRDAPGSFGNCVFGQNSEESPPPRTLLVSAPSLHNGRKRHPQSERVKWWKICDTQSVWRS